MSYVPDLGAAIDLRHLDPGSPTPYQMLLRVQSEPVSNWDAWRHLREVVLRSSPSRVFEIRRDEILHLMACTEDLVATRLELADTRIEAGHGDVSVTIDDVIPLGTDG